MTAELKSLENDPDGLNTYEYIVNNVDNVLEDLPALTENMKRVDCSGQFLCSTARFLSAVNREMFMPHIGPLIEGALERDRERKYIGSLLEAIWGEDYKERAEELSRSDNNFRRIYKRIFSTGI